MNISYRIYLFTEQELQRISKLSWRAYVAVGTQCRNSPKQSRKSLEVALELENKEPVRMLRVSGSYLRFDENGFVSFVRGRAIGRMETYEALERAKRAARS